MRIGERIKELRIEQGYTQAKLAKAIGVELRVRTYIEDSDAT